MVTDQHPDLMVNEDVAAVVEWAVDEAEDVVLDQTDVINVNLIGAVEV